MTARLSLFKILMAATALCAPGFSSAQAWPTHAVQIIVPYPPGGSSDVIARLLAVKLADSFKQPFLVDNRPGAGTMIGTTQVARAAPDGYTILIADVPFTVNASVLPKPTYDPIK